MAVPVSVTPAMWSRRPAAGAVPRADPQRQAGDHHALSAEPPDVIFQPAPGVGPRLAHQLGPAGHLHVDRHLAGRAGGRPVIVPRPGREAGREPRWCTRSRRRPRRTPGRPAQSPRHRWRRTPVRSARTPACRRPGARAPATAGSSLLTSPAQARSIPGTEPSCHGQAPDIITSREGDRGLAHTGPADLRVCDSGAVGGPPRVERAFCARAAALEALASVMGRSAAPAVLVLASPG
jgi:hypothetical protein